MRVSDEVNLKRVAHNDFRWCVRIRTQVPSGLTEPTDGSTQLDSAIESACVLSFAYRQSHQRRYLIQRVELIGGPNDACQSPVKRQFLAFLARFIYLISLGEKNLAGEPGAERPFLKPVYFQCIAQCRVNNVGVVCGGVNIVDMDIGSFWKSIWVDAFRIDRIRGILGR